MGGPQPAGLARGGRADEAREGEDRGGPRLVAVDPRARDLHAEDALRVALEGDGRVRGEVHAGSRQVHEGPELGQDDARDGQGRLVGTVDAARDRRLARGGGQ